MDVRPAGIAVLQAALGPRLQAGVLLGRYTAARIGGPAEMLLEVQTLDELVEAVRLCWRNQVDFLILGGGSNVLVSDAGVPGLVLINRARQVRFDERADPPMVRAESGANFGLLARQAAQLGLSGLEWAAGIPGSVGGAVVGNAGAHGSDMAGNLRLAEILHRMDSEFTEFAAQGEEPRREMWAADRLDFIYRGSLLKRQAGRAVVLAAHLQLAHSTPQAVQARIDEFVAHRRRTQPPGASMGSMFKNPPGDYAGRLIEAVGLKGARMGGAEISNLHANFFTNQGQATASDVYALIQMAQQRVLEKFGVRLELEIELLGEWE
ncbi:MAG: UDP-N-acetylmuramate dehydrogenase [Chloroflexota bacterium]